MQAVQGQPEGFKALHSGMRLTTFGYNSSNTTSEHGTTTKYVYSTTESRDITQNNNEIGRNLITT